MLIKWSQYKRNSLATNIENEDRKITSEQQEIVHFSSEGVIPSTTTLPDTMNLSTDYMAMTTKEERIHTVKDFLSRPIIVQTGLWSSNDPAETQLYTQNFPEALVANAMYQEKLKGFVGLRATLVVKVQVNSQPFQQGRLMLQYFPYAQYMPNRVSLVNSTLQGRSGCPRTDLDLSVGTEIEMRIPYVSPHVYYNLITGQGSFGAIYLVVYSQLRDQVSGTGAVEYTVWAHLEDVDVQYPTGANIFTGSSPNYATEALKMASGNFTEADLRQMYHDRTYEKKPDRIFAQAATELSQQKATGTISSGVGKVSEALNTLSTIPVIGKMFTRPAWISSKAANIFRMLGFSKPTIQSQPSVFKRTAQHNMANFDGADTSRKMALSAANEIETKRGLAGTSADEMDLSHVLSIPNFWDRFTWSTTDLTNSILWDNYVTPVKIKPYSSTITDRFRCTHMGYVANTHGLWRGSIVYTFKFVKTLFHSGRLRISFIPYYYNTTISTGVPDVSKTQKIIVDLRTCNEVAFTVPYVASRPWMYCIRPESSALGENNALMYNAVTGIVRVEVLNQLVAANNVYQSIDTIVEVSGGPDLTFALPAAPSYVPYGGTFTAEDTEASKRQYEEEYSNDVTDTKIRAQVMGENEAISRNDAQHGVHPEPIDTHNIASNWSPEAHCVGEKIMSIRQLIKRFGYVGSATLSTADSPITSTVGIAPFSVRYPTTSIGGVKNISLWEYYYFIYAFWRGSMRFKSTALAQNNLETFPSTKILSSFLNLSIINTVQDAFLNLISKFTAGGSIFQEMNVIFSGTFNNGPSLHVINNEIDGILEYEIPYYNSSHISPATIYSSTESPLEVTNVLKGHIPPVVAAIDVPFVNQAVTAETTIAMTAYRAAGDDHSLMYLVGVPPLVNVSRS